MNYLIFSDIHAVKKETVEKILLLYAGYEKYCTGDYGVCKELLLKYNVNYVCGNTDFDRNPTELICTIDGLKSFITHGHLYNVKNDYLNIYFKAKELGCSAVVFGHTHKFMDKTYHGMRFLNPGALCNGEYIVIENGLIRRKCIVLD